MSQEPTVEGPRNSGVYNLPDHLPRNAILRGMLATVMITIALCFATYLYTRLRMLQLRPSGVFPEQHLGPPHEVAHVRQEAFAVPHPKPTIIDRDRALLNSYGWVDRARGTVRLPVEVAIEVIAGRAQAQGGSR